MRILPATLTAAKRAAHGLGREEKLDTTSAPVFNNIQLLYWNKKWNTSHSVYEKGVSVPPKIRGCTSLDQWLVLLQCAVEKLSPSQRLRAHLQHICRGPVRKILPRGPPSDSAVKLLRQLPLPTLPHLRAHRKAQSSYFAASLQRWVSSRGNKHQKCKEVDQKKGESETQQHFAKRNTLQPNSRPAILCGWSRPFLHAQGQHLFPARCPSKTQEVRHACSTPNMTNPSKPRGWFKATHAFTNTHTLTSSFWLFLSAGSDPNPSLVMPTVTFSKNYKYLCVPLLTSVSDSFWYLLLKGTISNLTSSAIW